jgi:hypothetical protein
MNESAIRTVALEVRRLGAVMLESALFMQQELPRVPISDSLRAEAEHLCRALTGTRHDIASELTEIDAHLAHVPSSSAAEACVQRVLRWVREDIQRLHQLVMALEEATRRNPDYELAYALVAESATNILRAFDRAHTAARAVSIPRRGGEPRETGMEE